MITSAVATSARGAFMYLYCSPVLLLVELQGSLTVGRRHILGIQKLGQQVPAIPQSFRAPARPQPAISSTCMLWAGPACLAGAILRAVTMPSAAPKSGCTSDDDALQQPCSMHTACAIMPSSVLPDHARCS